GRLAREGVRRRRAELQVHGSRDGLVQEGRKHHVGLGHAAVHAAQPGHPLRHRCGRIVLVATLRTTELTKSYGGRTVVKGVNVEIASGEVVGLLGANGAGKTTTFSMVVGLTAPDTGRVLLDGIDVTDDPMYLRARKGIGYLPQEASIFRGLTVEQNIMAILE